MSERTCETCRWFVRDAGTEGHCRRYPPTATDFGDTFAAVSADDWCGEHRPQERKPERQFEWTTDWGVVREDSPKINDVHPFHSPEFAAKVSESIKSNLDALWGVPQPVAYCIQCADDDPKVHSLSFDKAALSRIVTRHGGKVVPLYLGKP